MIAEQQILYPKEVCQNCLLSDKKGLPRWHDSKLACGKVQPRHTFREAKIYRCQMGFRVTRIS